MKNLANLRKDKTGIFKHREWRGFKDTFYDFGRWLITWKDLIKFVGKSPIKVVKALKSYRWMASYLTTPAFVDRATSGMRDTELRATHLHYNAIVKKLTDILTASFRADRNLSKNAKGNDKIIYVDELIPPQLFKGFKNLRAIPAQAAPIFTTSMVDQQIPKYYLDAIESFGVPADVCPLPSAEAGVAALNEYPLIGKCFISCNMPCDGSIMTSSFQDRRFKLPTFPLGIPLRYNRDSVQQFSVQELKDCIAFIENQTGEKYDYDELKKCCEIFNRQNELELEKWKLNTTDYPQVVGSTLWIYRLFYYQSAAGTDKWIVKTDEKVNKLIMKAYENKIPVRKDIRHRAIIWSCPANYYTDFPVWLENCWGIVGLMDMETSTSTIMIDTSSPDSMLQGIATTYQRAVMRKHTKGGYANVLDELWRVVKEYDADMVLMYDQISCKGMDGLNAMFEEQARERGIKLMWVQQDLLDPTTISRRDMREQVNKYMTAVLNEKPLDESLLDFDDSLSW